MRLKRLGFRRGAIGVLLALRLVPGPAGVAAAAEGPGCSKYAVRGIAPGMRASEVGSRLGSGGIPEPVTVASAPRTGVTFLAGGYSVYVLYDRDLSTDPDARVALVRARVVGSVADPVGFVRSVVPGLGEPVLGKEHLEDGFMRGATVWADGACGVEVTAYRKETDWWQPGQGDLFVEIESNHAAGAAAALAAGAPSTAPLEPPPELTVTLETAAPPSEAGAAPSAAAAAPAAAAAASSEAAADAPGAPAAEAVGPTRVASSYAPPLYPERAQRLGIAATVVLSVEVRRDGSVGEVGVLETTRKGMGFEQAAVDAVKRWRYQPATRGGTPEDATITVRINFQ